MKLRRHQRIQGIFPLLMGIHYNIVFELQINKYYIYKYILKHKSNRLWILR